MAAHPGSETQADLLSLPKSARLAALAVRLQEQSLASGTTVASAESCTGGLLGHVITGVAGSSAYYLGGIISYSNEVKIVSLDVDPAAIERHGAVSAQVARSMASGIRSRFGVDYGVAVTGVAGPGGGSLDKPVGLTYVAAAGPSGEEVRRYHWNGDRTSNKQDSVEAALELLLQLIEADRLPSPAATEPSPGE